MTAVWQGGHTYVPGSLVVPTAGATPVQLQPDNAGFETGDLTGWTTSDPTHWTVGAHKYEGAYGCRISGSALTSMQSNTKPTVKAGQSVSVSVKAEITNAGTDDAHFQVVLQWFDIGGALVSFVAGNEVQGKGGFWTTSSASGVAPAGTVSFSLSLSANPGTHGSVIDVDSAAYTYAYGPPTAGIVYKATQAAPAKSAATEPAWPGVVGVPITDGGVTWEGELETRLVWQASPLSKSGGTEPDWPLATGANVHDGTINYTAQTLQITDPNCPHSKVVAIVSSKVFAGDKDITPFCATVNPPDWSSAQDAGYLPTGLQQANSNDVAVLAPYRSNLCVFNASSFQNWQVDPDPAAMSILDQMDGIGSSAQHAAQPVGNDLFYLSQLGVRSVSIAGGTDSLSAGDVGMPIDPLVREAMAGDNSTLGPIATYYPSAGQYWLAFKPGRPVITGSLHDGCNDATYVASLGLSRGITPYTNPLVSSGTAPDGISLEVVDDALHVTFVDADAGDYLFFLTADDSVGSTSTPFRCVITIHDFQIAGSLPDGAEGVAYSHALALSDGVAPFGTPSITSGTMPTGGTLTIDGETVVVAWSDTVPADTYDFDFSITDATGCVATYIASVTVGETFRGAVLFDDPIFYLPLDETSGTLAADITGNGHDGTYTGTYTHSTTELIAGDHSLGVGASSSRGRVSIPDGAYGDVFTTDHWTLLALAKSASLTPLPGATPTICAKFYSPNFGHISGAINFRDEPRGIAGSYTDTSLNTDVANHAGLAITTAFMIMVVRDWNPATGVTLSLYINGTLVSTKIDPTNALGITTSTFPFEIGGNANYPDSYQWWGNIGHVAFFDKSISAARALQYAQLAGYHV